MFEGVTEVGAIWIFDFLSLVNRHAESLQT